MYLYVFGLILFLCMFLLWFYRCQVRLLQWDGLIGQVLWFMAGLLRYGSSNV